jgi:hypothetical protein
MIYTIEQKIQTLAENVVMANQRAPSFSIENIEFVHWEFSITHGWSQDSWLARRR